MPLSGFIKAGLGQGRGFIAPSSSTNPVQALIDALSGLVDGLLLPNSGTYAAPGDVPGALTDALGGDRAVWTAPNTQGTPEIVAPAGCPWSYLSSDGVDDTLMADRALTTGWFCGVFRSPPWQSTWKGYGPLLDPATYTDDDHSLGLLHKDTTNFYNSPFPRSVRRDGEDLSSPFSLAPITDWMVVSVYAHNPAAARTLAMFVGDEIFFGELHCAALAYRATDPTTEDQTAIEAQFAIIRDALNASGDYALLAFDADDLAGNGYDGSGTPAQSPLARLTLSTNAERLHITGSTDIHDSFAQFAHLGLRINGAAQSPLAFAANGSQGFNRALGAGEKTIEIITGLQSRPDSDVLGTFLSSVRLSGGTHASIIAPSAAQRLVIIADSIGVGANATNPETEGWAALMRTSYSRNPLVDAWGYRALHDIATDGAARTAFAARIAALNPAKIWLPLGTNDYGLQAWRAADYGAAYADLLDEMHAAMSDVTIYCQSPIQRISPSGEGGNTFGDSLSDYRSQVSAAAAARTGYCIYVEGAAGALVSNAGMSADGLHPSTAGHAEYAGAVDDVLG